MAVAGPGGHPEFDGRGTCLDAGARRYDTTPLEYRSARSREGDGATFLVTLPLAQPADRSIDCTITEIAA